MEAIGQPIIDAALAEVKSWLRISLSDDDEGLMALCRSAIAMAEDFCAQRLFVRGGTEIIAASLYWERMRACPVRSVGAAQALKADGSTVPLPVTEYAADIDAAGDGWVRVVAPMVGDAFPRMELFFVAGLAESWTDIPDALRQGVVRLAAHLFVNPDGGAAPPAIVTALWRPWRRMRLA
ncbi:MAG: hypothetical protein E2598_11905 [Sphingobium sp.]|nr:hypothetical protein [Sphingobium sp.]